MAISLIETASLDTGLVAPTATALTTASGSAPSYSARAWVNFNGTGTVAIRASGNVSSITDNGTGQYTVNFTTAMPDTNYNVVGAGRYTSGNGGIIIQPGFDTTGTTSAIRIIAMPTTGTAVDAEYMNVSIFR
jgi:hypothetical protein